MEEYSVQDYKDAAFESLGNQSHLEKGQRKTKTHVQDEWLYPGVIASYKRGVAYFEASKCVDWLEYMIQEGPLLPHPRGIAGQVKLKYVPDDKDANLSDKKKHANKRKWLSRLKERAEKKIGQNGMAGSKREAAKTFGDVLSQKQVVDNTLVRMGKKIKAQEDWKQDHIARTVQSVPLGPEAAGNKADDTLPVDIRDLCNFNVDEIGFGKFSSMLHSEGEIEEQLGSLPDSEYGGDRESGCGAGAESVADSHIPGAFGLPTQGNEAWIAD